MSDNSSATALAAPALSLSRAGLWWGLLGVAAFSCTVPFTRVAVGSGGISPLFVGSGRAVIAAALAAAALVLTRQRLPHGVQWARLGVVAGGIVVGFPFLTSYALTTAPASHSAVVIAILPAATAAVAALRGQERPSAFFWGMAVVGAAVAIVFAALSGGGFTGLHWSDLMLFGAVIAAAIGYAEGGLLARELGAWQTISWALVMSAPAMVPVLGVSMAQSPPSGTPVEWAAFGYLAVVSMYLGFFAWYRGLAIGPIAQVSQVQLVQPVLSVCLAAVLLHERLTWVTVVGGFAVLVCAAVTVRTRLRFVANPR
ncbi:DMT family transporter [Spiractinospora alimapuensis]|uniref:DMT family transporter n=1 Tax=Spiractinospora alimapuensis TaxID=2820884 RepID=UPI001F37E4F8|nr:DMT family transporter [Spiractinospora alimapuensis]QVQ54301.1 DMT family transporter [Spiractinospora alimapuensis]